MPETERRWGPTVSLSGRQESGFLTKRAAIVRACAASQLHSQSCSPVFWVLLNIPLRKFTFKGVWRCDPTQSIPTNALCTHGRRWKWWLNQQRIIILWNFLMPTLAPIYSDSLKMEVFLVWDYGFFLNLRASLRLLPSPPGSGWQPLKPCSESVDLALGSRATYIRRSSHCIPFSTYSLIHFFFFFSTWNAHASLFVANYAQLSFFLSLLDSRICPKFWGGKKLISPISTGVPRALCLNTMRSLCWRINFILHSCRVDVCP